MEGFTAISYKTYHPTYLESVEILDAVIGNRLTRDYEVSNPDDLALFFESAYINALMLLAYHVEPDRSDMYGADQKQTAVFDEFLKSTGNAMNRKELVELLQMAYTNMFHLYERIAADIQMDDDRYRIGGICIEAGGWIGPLSAFRNFIVNRNVDTDDPICYRECVRKFFNEIVLGTDTLLANTLDNDVVVNVKFSFTSDFMC
jgi:hypothetical protein